MTNILVINAGSSSLKFQIIDSETEKVLIKGNYEGISLKSSIRKIIYNSKKFKDKINIKTHKEAIENLITYLLENKLLDLEKNVRFVGHRVVHGGEKYSNTVEINNDVLKTLEENSFLAPLHNPVNIKCIEILKEKLKNARHFAIFDTAFHQTMPKDIYLYGLSLDLYKKHKIRKYGFHGTSHKFVLSKYAEIINKNTIDQKIITCHIGNGQSICAIKDNKSYDTSMGFTPLEGLVMGTRAGSFDPEIILFLLDQGYSKEEIKHIINKKSGLLGISNISSDHRFIEESSIKGEKDAVLANNILVNRIVKTIGSYISELNGVDTIIFTAGVGENSPYLRKLVLDHFKYLGLELDDNKNNQNKTFISKDTSKIKALVIPTNEELQIAREVKKFI